jgi:hypothetical protein
MAYLRKKEETVEVAYPLNKVWVTIKKVLVDLKWNIEQTDETAHHIKAKTTDSLMFLGSVLLIDVAPINKNTTKVAVVAETPVTTITAMADFGQANRRLDLFFAELAEQLAS